MPKRKSYKKKLPKYSNGGPPVNGKHQADILNAKTYLTSMANSPLFAERYQKMTGETNPEVIERARQNILSNISNTGVDYISPFAMQMRGSKGFMDYDKNKLFLSERIKNKDLTASDLLTHELSHGSLPMPNPDDIQQNKLSDPRFGNIINLNQYAKLKKQYEQQFSPFVDGKPNERFTREFRGTPGIFERRDAFLLAGNRGNLSSYEDEMANQFFNYLTDPTEIKSRVDVGRRFLKDKGLYDPTTQRFTDKDYDNLKKEFENLPRKQHKEKYESYGDIFDLLYNYPKEDVINMFNSFVSNKPDTNTNLNINQAKHGGYIHTNMAGKINKRKGLPTNFPRYNGGGYGVGSAALTGALNSTLGPTSGNFNWLSLAPSAMGLARSFQQPQGEMDYGTNEYFQDRNRQAGQVAAGNQLLTTGLNMVAPGAGTAVQLLGTLGNLAANKDQYGVASTGAGAVVEDILNPVQKFANVGEELKKGDIKQAFLEGLPGYGGIAQRKQAMGEVNSLYNKFTTQRTTDQQDAYTQNVKAAEGQYLAYGGYMPYYALGGRARYFNGGRMANPYNKEPNAEIENEVVNHADGGIQDFSHLPRHENATEKNLVNMEDGSFVFSNRIKNPATGNYFAKDAKPLNTSQQEKILADGNTTPLTKNSAKLMFSTKKILADRLAELHEATKTYNDAQKAENEATEEFIGMLGGMYGKGGLIKRKDGSYSPRGLWDNIRANRGSGKKPTKAMLEQERKIKAQEKAMGGYMYANGGSFNNPGFMALPKYVQAKIKGNYADGGYALGESYDLSDAEIKELKRKGYTFDIE